MILADEFIQMARPHPGGERLLFGHQFLPAQVEKIGHGRGGLFGDAG